MDRYAVMGNPVAHSRSPEIHARFAEETRQAMTYDRILVPLDGFAEAVAAFAAAGGRGLNVTVPFKEQAWAVADRRTERAQRAGAVNTLVLEWDRRLGDNTDGVGLVRDLRDNLGVPLRGRRILFLGAGGAVRGVLPSVLAEGPARVLIANRTGARAEKLARELADLGPLRGGGLDALGSERFDIVINAISAGLHGEMPDLPDHLLAGDAVCYDMVYADEPTVFMRWGGEHGASRVSDGLGMLVEQAAESFQLWRGVRPGTRAVIDALRER